MDFELEADEEQEPVPCVRCHRPILTPKLHGYNTSGIAEITRLECTGCVIEQDLFGAPFDVELAE